MFQAVISDSVMASPRPAVSVKAGPVPRASASPNARLRNGLRVDMLDPPCVVDAPAGDAVVVLVRERERGCNGLVSLPARGHELRTQRLHVAGLVPRAALQHHRLAVPAPRHPKAS